MYYQNLLILMICFQLFVAIFGARVCKAKCVTLNPKFAGWEGLN